MTETLDQNQWNDYLARLEYLNKGIIRTKIKLELLNDSDRFYYDRTGQLSTVPSMFIGGTLGQLETLNREAGKLNLIYDLVNSGRVGVLNSYDVPGDFDLVAVQGNLSNQEIADLKVNLDALYEPNKLEGALGIAPIIIAAGVVVTALVVGAVISVTAMITKQEEIEAEIDAKQIELEHKILANPAIIDDWANYKQAVQGETRGVIDEFLGTGATKKLFAGAAGVVFLVVAGYFVLKYMEKKKTT
jgi:hypothetical protein